MFKTIDNSGALVGKLLIATPPLDGSCFEKSIVYICSHNESGAMGLLINHVMTNITAIDVLEQLNIKNGIKQLPTIHFGGPIETSRGFILHTSDYKSSNTQNVEHNISITATVDIIQDIVNGKGPSKSLVFLGYAGWQAGQLEEEIKSNIWIPSFSSEDIIFNSNNDEKWNIAAKYMGTDIMRYSTIVGHA